MDYTIITKHSETIKFLKVFQDKKSGKVIESRKILRDSFYFLRRKDMLLVLKAFLYGSKADMDWVSLRMQKLWFPELMPHTTAYNVFWWFFTFISCFCWVPITIRFCVEAISFWKEITGDDY